MLKWGGKKSGSKWGGKQATLNTLELNWELDF
jgi:hypothetical protein